ncbi:hypothetical protein SAMN06264364_14125 [Quadrisphaera granulorum]|uniref:ABC transporter n=1 Tax=Quadrisphaera granulorum TaxID=317664 RepID=A0A315ZQF4_9ACTN|nr:DUF808 domain-containing protein [Quadrisphaera granulorum]PWJ47128.1 hypothetical protein BXY45_14125 [Quadrisphaera granulorum]SZE98932.1 hypothetical protein SAMN06264364_14125 [Quadrisphaera granulorum]
MSGGLFALLDDVAALVRMSAASIDDVAAATGRASAKAAGVVVDDAAVTPRYVQGIEPKRELSIIWRIAKGSIRNKLLFILPIALLLSAFLPWLLTPILMLGGAYLSYEGAEKVWEKVSGHGGGHGAGHGGGQGAEDDDGGAAATEAAAAQDPAEREKGIVAAAVRTDLILSAEIMVIALNEVDTEPVWEQAIILAVVAFFITAVVYGAVALIVKMDDIGLALAQRSSSGVAAFGRGLVKAMPVVLSTLATVGVVAMLWVGGHILLVGADELGWHGPYGLVHHAEEAVHQATGALGGVLGWLTNTAFSAVAGALVGAVIILITHLVPKRGAKSH